MAGFDPQAFEWEYRASLRGPNFADPLIALLPRPCVQVLDAGCGGGRLAVRLATQVGSVIGLDLSKTMLTFAQGRQVAEGLDNIMWVRGDLQDLPFPSSNFDCVLSTYALHHVDLDRALPELKRVIKPAGRLLLQDMPFASSVWLRKLFQWRFALGVSMKALTSLGARPAWQIFVLHARPLLSGEEMHQAPWTGDRVRDACSRHLPGWRFVQGQQTLILWDKA